MNYDLILKNGTAIFPWGESKADIGVRDGRIASLSVTASDGAAQVVNAAGLHILPGLIDSHVHFRDPGMPDVETIETGTRGAALGGVTTVLDMPNTAKPVIDKEMLDWKYAHISRNAHVDVGMYIGATRENIPEIPMLETQPGVCAVKLFAASSTGSLLIADDAGIEALFRSGRRRIAIHSEDEYRLQARKSMFHQGQPYATHAEWRDAECAFLGTRRVVALARKTGRPIHILHTSTAEELNYLGQCRDIATVEVLVNHLTQYGPDCYDRLGSLAVMNPPLRDRPHFEASWAALQDGRVDIVSSDHAPHALEKKQNPWPDCPAGLTGVQTIVPVMLDHVNAGRLSLSRLVDLMAAGPARVYHMPTKGRLAVGFDADFTLVDMGRKQRITNAMMATPVKWTPFDGVTVQGWPVGTIVRGHYVMRDGVLVEENRGRPVSFLSG